MSVNDIPSAGRIIVGADAVIDFGWDEPDPTDPTGRARRAKNISGDTVTASFRLRLGGTPFLTKTSANVAQIVIDSTAGVSTTDPDTGELVVRHGYVIVDDTDLIGQIGQTSDLYVTFTLNTNEGPRSKSVVRLRAVVVE